MPLRTVPSLEAALRQTAALAEVPGLPADALLCIRRVHARIDREGLRHVGGLLGAADQLSRQLQKHAGDARRPAREFVPKSAEAVRFEDPAEMLACAARDWLDGQFYSHWWWRSLLGGGALAQGVVTLWRRYPAHIPAALAKLDARAGEFRQRLPAPDAAAIADLLAECPNRTARQENSSQPTTDDPRQPPPTFISSAARAGSSNAPPPIAASPATQPWFVAPGGNKAVQPGSGGTLRDAHEACRPGAEVESSVFAAPGASAEARAQRRTPAGVDKSPRGTNNLGIPAQERPQVRQQPDLRKQGSAADPANDQFPRPRQPQPEQRESLAPPIATTLLSQVGRFEQTGETASASASLVKLIAAGESIETDYGGVLYLLNTALRLGFYPDFTRPQDPGLALSPWAFLALCGERIAGRGLREDALWTLLAKLAVGSDEQTHGASTTNRPPPSLPDALRPYLGRRSPNACLTPDSWPAWLDQLIPPLRRRLAAALGVAPRSVGRLLCRQAARVQYREGRLTTRFDLNDHPVAIRRAGLDRDPGWIPAAACDIRFYYDT